jgi:hypothetical protein
MPRGSKPGERRGGRQRATPNKRTVLTERIVAVASADPTASYDEIVAILVKDKTLPASSRVAVARKCFAVAPLRSVHDRSEKANARAFQAIERTGPIKPHGGAARATSQSKTSASGASITTNLAILQVLFSIVQDSATKTPERRQAASELAQYFLPKKPTKKKSRYGNFPPDEFGFVVDPDLARELRDATLELACLPLVKRKFTPYAMAQKASKLQARIKEIQQSLQCPCSSKYKLKDEFDGTKIDGQIPRDNDRLKILGKQRVDKKMFTPEEDLEEAICTARYDSFIKGPEMAARERLAELRRSKSPLLTPAQKATVRLLTLLYPAPPRPEPDERTLAEHPFQDLPVVEEEDFIEFVEVPRFINGNPNYPQKEAADRLEAASPKR